MSEGHDLSSDFVDGLLAKFGASPKPAVVTLPDGSVLTFRQIQSYGDLTRFNKKTAEFVKSLKDRKRFTGTPIADFVPLEDEEAIAAFTIQELSLEPKFGTVAALKLLSAPWLVAFILRELDSKRMVYLAERYVEGVESGKVESAPTESSAPVSP